MKRIGLVLLAVLLCAGTALAQETVYVGERYSVSSGYTLTVFWPDGNAPERKLLEDIQTVFFGAYPEMRETFGTTDSLSVNIYLKDSGQMPANVPAYTAGDSVHCAVSFLEQDRGNLNCLVHELFHVVQNGYPGAEEDAMIAALCEGLADYARDAYGVMHETNWQLPDYAPGQSLTDAYGVTAAFLKWGSDHWGSDLCLRLNRALHEGRYTEAFWKDATGASLETLWEMYAQM